MIRTRAWQILGALSLLALVLLPALAAGGGGSWHQGMVWNASAQQGETLLEAMYAEAPDVDPVPQLLEIEVTDVPPFAELTVSIAGGQTFRIFADAAGNAFVSITRRNAPMQPDGRPEESFRIDDGTTIDVFSVEHGIKMSTVFEPGKPIC